MLLVSLLILMILQYLICKVGLVAFLKRVIGVEIPMMSPKFQNDCSPHQML